MTRHYSRFDQTLINFNKALDRISLLRIDAISGVALSSPTQTYPASPAQTVDDVSLSPTQQQHHAGLMRIDHTGEVCAQALYLGQALTARKPATRNLLLDSATEEYAHLCWCAERLQQLEAKPSLLNPLFYAGSLTLGASVGLLGDGASLGFIAATEELVGEHLQDHLRQIADQDPKSRAVLTQMHTDELSHAHKARVAGGWYFPPLVKKFMRALSKIMVITTYRC